MTPNDLSDRIESITGRAEENLTKAVTQTQKKLFEQMQTTLSKLELDAEGMILQTGSNRKILQKADRAFDKAMKNSGYYESLNQYTGAITALTDANSKYFDFILDTFTPDAHYLKSLQKSSVETIVNLLANDGLEVQLKQPLMNILNQNVNSGASLSDMLRQVREFIQGSPDAEGKLLRYSKQVSKDTLFQFSRSMQESISQNSGLNYYLYAGGLMDTSRPFCIARAGKYFHRKEIESWPKLNWAGKRPGTTKSSIYVYLAGYQCTHSLIPVSEAVVPKDVLDRNS